MQLHLVADQERVDGPPRRPFDLAATPLRPGVAHEELALVLDAALADRVEQRAVATGLPAPVWAGMVIESQRALAAAAPGHEEELSRVLDDLAAQQPDGLLAQRSRRLVRYGLALRAGSARPAQPARRSLRVVTTQQSMIAWELAAAASGQIPARWAVDILAGLPTGREMWEAASAIAGLMLGEWVAVQAARRSSA